INRKHGPTALVLTRQKLPTFDRTKMRSASGLAHGAYILWEPEKTPEAIAIATGSEVQIAVAAAEACAKEGIALRVVSMPCFEAFAAETKEYRDQVLPPALSARVSIEAGVTFGWKQWVGDRGIAIGLDRYGASAPAEVNFEKLGFTTARVVESVKQL